MQRGWRREASDGDSVGQKAVQSGHEEAGEHDRCAGTKRSEFQNLRAPTLVLGDEACGIHRTLLASQMKMSSLHKKHCKPMKL
jgi:hypothetical protein